MKFDKVLMVAAVALFMASPPAILAADGKGAGLIPGQFVLTGSKVKKIYTGKLPRDYRVCVKAEKDSAPMKVTFDEQQSTLQPGDCKDVTGKKIEATPAEALTGSTHIVATFHREKPAKLATKK
jgi:hypothetical protein